MSTEATQKKAVVTIEHKGTVYEVGHRAAVSAARHGFIVGLNMLPRTKAQELQKKMFEIAAKEEQKPEAEVDDDLTAAEKTIRAKKQAEAQQFQQFVSAIKSGDLTADQILSVNDPMTPEELAQFDGAYKHMFRAVADTRGLPEELAALIKGDLDSEFYRESVDVEEVKALANSFRKHCNF